MPARTRPRTPAGRRGRGRTAAAITLTAAVTAGAATLLTGCASTVAVGAGAPGAAGGGASAPAGSASASGSSSARPAPSGSGSGSAAPVLNGTADNRLTISDGTSTVVMNGGTVDFGTVVRDLAWNPTGTKAAFIDGSGNLDVANADGTGRVMVARAPGGENWSHPTWQVTPYKKESGVPAGSLLYFAAAKGGVSRLKSVASTAVNGTPQVMGVDAGVGTGTTVPVTGNAWPSAGGTFGNALFANAAAGEVYLRDDYLREQTAPLARGSEPSISPDGDTAAFVRSVDGHDHLFVESLQDDRVAKDLTPNATTDYTEPAWSPDGRTIAVRVPDGVATLPADGSAAPTRISSVTGLPAYR